MARVKVRRHARLCLVLRLGIDANDIIMPTSGPAQPLRAGLLLPSAAAAALEVSDTLLPSAVIFMPAASCSQEHGRLYPIQEACLAEGCRAARSQKASQKASSSDSSCQDPTQETQEAQGHSGPEVSSYRMCAGSDAGYLHSHRASSTCSYSYSYSIWHGRAVQPTREPEAQGVPGTNPSLAKTRSRSILVFSNCDTSATQAYPAYQYPCVVLFGGSRKFSSQHL
jgi:hypothetical protein